jgi:isoleucyl-tRNA synthetase
VPIWQKNMNFKEYKQVDYAQIADEILKFWREENIFEKSVTSREGKPTFTFYEGPPSANGKPGIHHVMARAIKDIFCRYQTLKGKQVSRKGGWDTHGLPVELQVEKELGITKEDIGKTISVEEYNQKCRETVMRFTDIWQDMTDKMGYWVDMEKPYVTYENDYIESVWYLLKELYKKGLLYKGYTIQPYSPAAGTGLSSHELNMPGTYKDVKDTSLTAQFKVADLEKFNRLNVWYNLDFLEIRKPEGNEIIDIKTYRKQMESHLFENVKGKKIFNSSFKKDIQITRRGIKEVLTFSPTYEDIASLILIEEIVETSIWIETEKSLYDQGETFHYLLHGIKINNKIFIVKTVIKQIGLDYRLYDITLTEKEKSQVFGIARISESDDDKHLGRRKDKRLFNILQIKNQDFLKKLPYIENLSILAWTTTPWTLPSNAALTVGKNIEYVIVKTFNPYTYLPINVVLAKDLVGKYFQENGKDADFESYKGGDKVIPWSIISTCKGADLEGIEYEQLMPYVQPESAAFRVIIGDFVTTEDGTGVVHTAPTFGADDFRVAQQHGIPAILVKDVDGKEVPLVNKQGKFVAEVTDFALEYVKEAYLSDEEIEIEKTKQGRDKYLSVDERIAIKLKTENKAFNVQRYEHTYPHCWRTDKPILYYPLDSWFIRTTAVKDKLIELNKTINWKPESTGTGRFGNWLENLVDWNLSRSRYWGTPLPIWRSEDGEEVCIGSVEELVNGVKHALKDDVLSDWQRKKNEEFLASYLSSGSNNTIDLHRPFVDEIFLVSASGKVMTRETDLIDVWFDSGAMPYAQWHYPFEAPLGGLEAVYPADFISEGVDQTRGWFFTLHAISGMVSDSVAFKNVVSTGLVLDKNGNKMSKRLGNAVDPFETLEKYGADPTRWYMITNAQPWDNLKFDLAGITEVRNKFFGTLTNTYNFFALYANLDNYSINEFDRVPHENLSELDRWIISKLVSLIREVDLAYADYEPTKAGRAIQEFVNDHLSNWYVRLSRRRFWQGEMTVDKNGAYETLQHCLVAVAQLMSPIAPFYSDWLYKNMTDHIRKSAIEKGTPFAVESIHLSDFHTDIPEWIDRNLEESMDLAQRICSLVHSMRKANRLKVRQPLSKILIPVLSEKIRQQIRSVEEIIKNEVNIKHIEYLDDASGVLSKKVKPNFKTLGPHFGKDMKAVANGIQEMNAVDLETLEKTAEFQIPNTEFRIHLDDVEILTEDMPGFITAKENDLIVALDIEISPTLRQEGIARDFVNRVQNYRKDTGFEVTDKISISLLNSNAEISDAVISFKEYIATEVQAKSIEIVDNLTESVEVEMDEIVLKWKILVV